MEDTRRRLQFDASARLLQVIDQIAEEVDTNTRADVLRRAVEVYAKLLAVAREDGQIMLARKDGTPERWVL